MGRSKGGFVVKQQNDGARCAANARRRRPARRQAGPRRSCASRKRVGVEVEGGLQVRLHVMQVRLCVVQSGRRTGADMLLSPRDQRF
eukprot:6214282-Pleurochrysis_carterae.AAC.3